jgi:hypothetical protein
MKDLVKTINDFEVKLPAKLKKALNKFFNEVDCAEGCTIRGGWDYNAPYALIIESSSLYHYLQGEYGWDVHTKFYNAFKGTGYHPDMLDSCTVGFYKD